MQRSLKNAPEWIVLQFGEINRIRLAIGLVVERRLMFAPVPPICFRLVFVGDGVRQKAALP